jgi:multicomponent Na+:H+ antiporter subunit G
MMEWITSIFLIIGCFFVLIAVIGLLRFPDLYTRMHAAAKAGAFGGSILLLTAAVCYGRFEVWLEVIMIIIFFYLTTPVASHMIGRAAYLSGAPIWKGTLQDELKGKYDRRKKELSS